MIYLGPEKIFKGRMKEFRGRVLYADSRSELYEALKKLGRPFAGIRENPWRYLLSYGWAWQFVRLRDCGFVGFEELTFFEEQEFIDSHKLKEI